MTTTEFFSVNELNPVDGNETEEATLPFTVELLQPVEVGKETITELTFSRYPTYKDISNIPTNTEAIRLGHFMPVISGMAGVPMVAVQKMSVKDVQRIMERIGPFVQG